MGRVREMIEVDGRDCWTLFDAGARNTYGVPAVASVLGTSQAARPIRTVLGEGTRETTRTALLEAQVEGHLISTHAMVVDEIGADEDGRRIEILFGALAMQQWGIRPIPDEERLDLSHYPEEFVEFQWTERGAIMNRLKKRLISLVTTQRSDPVFNRMNHIVLPAKLGRDVKMSALSRVHEHVQQMIMHPDTLRQRNLNVALIVFAGLSGFQVKFGQGLQYWPVGVATILIMSVFFLLDFKYHVYCHGYQATSHKVSHKMAEIDSDGDIEFDLYDFNYAATAELRSLSAIVYYGLLIGAVLTWAVLRLGWLRLLAASSVS